MTEAVLDTSALLALLLDEPGHRKVLESLDVAAITTINLGEVVGHFARKGATAAEIHEVLDLERVPFGEELAYATGFLLPAAKAAGLSFGDRACIALARRLGVKVLTADRAWQRIAKSVQVEIEVIR
jgi:PIN domain nuclease of toxin-antitoxin system